MIRIIIKGEVDLPGGRYLVAVAEVPEGVSYYRDKKGNVRREFWKDKRLFKRKINADKYCEKIRAENRNIILNNLLLSKGIFNFN